MPSAVPHLTDYWARLLASNQAIEGLLLEAKLQEIDREEEKYCQLPYFLEKYQNDLTDIQAHLRTQFFHRIIHEWASQYPNVHLDYTDIQLTLSDTYGPTWFDADTIRSYLMSKYASNASTLAYKTILTEAENLLPYQSRTLQHILAGRRLTLHCSMEKDFTTKKRTWLGYWSHAPLVSFGKLIAIHLHNASPETARSVLPAGLLLSRHEPVTGIKWHTSLYTMQFTQGHKMTVTFSNEQDARVIANALIARP